MKETVSAEEGEVSMAFPSTTLKLQLAKETGKKEGMPRGRTFVEYAQDRVDTSA